MAQDLAFLSTDDVAFLKQWIGVIRNQDVNTLNRPRTLIPLDTSADLYAVLTPDGGIPGIGAAANYRGIASVSSAECVLLRLDVTTPVMQLCAVGDGRSVTVHNSMTRDVPGNEVVIAAQDRYGKWQAISSSAGTSGGQNYIGLTRSAIPVGTYPGTGTGTGTGTGSGTGTGTGCQGHAESFAPGQGECDLYHIIDGSSGILRPVTNPLGAVEMVAAYNLSTTTEIPACTIVTLVQDFYGNWLIVNPNQTGEGDSFQPCFDTSTPVPVTIPDDDSGGVDLEVTVSGLPTDMPLMAVSLEITHAWIGDLVVTLTDPNAHTVTLINRINSGAGTCAGIGFNVVLMQSANRSIQKSCNGISVVLGTFAPSSAFSGFSGDPNGTWTLNVSDHDAIGTGTVDSLRLCFGEDNAPITDMVGASSTVDGEHGLVPAPLIADRLNFLRGDATWVAGLSSPLTTKGDLWARSATVDARFPVGTNGFTIYADSTQTLGIKWAAAYTLAIGNSVGSGTASNVLFVDGSGNLGQYAAFTLVVATGVLSNKSVSTGYAARFKNGTNTSITADFCDDFSAAVFRDGTNQVYICASSGSAAVSAQDGSGNTGALATGGVGGSFSNSGPTNYVLLADGSYAVNVLAGSIITLGTGGNTYRWATGTSAPTPQTLLALPLSTFGAGTISQLLGTPDVWVLVNVNGTNYKMPLYL